MGEAATLRIRSRRDGFRRAGLAHPASWVEHDARALGGARIAMLLGEPMLEIECVEAEPVAPIAPPADKPARGRRGAAPGSGG